MTRDFNKHRRDDMRPSTRRSSSEGRYEERSTRPARPRLNRAMVDRAWEEGAQSNHADYHPRSRGQAQPNSYRSNRPQYGHPSHPNGGSSRRPSPNRQPQPYGYGDPQESSQGRYGRDNKNRYASTNRERSGSYQEQRPYDRYPGQDRPYRRNGASHPASRGPARDDRPSRGYERGNGATHRSGGFQRERGEQRGAPRSHEETYEGDYERFSSYSPPYPSHRPFQGSGRSDYRDRHDDSTQPRERHVTRLPDGRVLKGPRPVQRRQAEYWNEVAQDSEQLLQQVHEPTTEDPNEQQAGRPTKRRESARGDAANTRTSAAKKERSSSPRGKQAREKHASAEKPRRSGPKPSQRGFKWPTP